MSVLPETNDLVRARDSLAGHVSARPARRERAARDRNGGRVALNYGPPAGFGPLREWLGNRHAVEPARIVVMPGSLIGLNFLVAHVLGDGDRAVVEAPTYDRMLHTLDAAGVEIVSVDRRDDGLDLDRLHELAGGAGRKFR